MPAFMFTQMVKYVGTNGSRSGLGESQVFKIILKVKVDSWRYKN